MVFHLISYIKLISTFYKLEIALVRSQITFSREFQSGQVNVKVIDLKDNPFRANKKIYIT
ncbi:hypothetical protein ASG81_25325 [Paenibacillus sp. Soil522]|nr:hypothetical protein ASG81_25325 [Paenibacillus sp. Soil522]